MGFYRKSERKTQRAPSSASPPAAPVSPVTNVSRHGARLLRTRDQPRPTGTDSPRATGGSALLCGLCETPRIHDSAQQKGLTPSTLLRPARRPSPTPGPLQPLFMSTVSEPAPPPERTVAEITPNATFGVTLHPAGRIRSCSVSVHGLMAHFILVLNNVPRGLPGPQLLCAPTERHLGCFRVLAVMKKVRHGF